MTKNGKLSKREMEMLNKAWGIVSDWSKIHEDDCVSDNEEVQYLYESAMNAVCGLCEFINNYED